MFTKTIIPKTASVTIQLPDDFVGEEVRVIAMIERKGDKSDNLKEKARDIKKKVLGLSPCRSFKLYF